MPGLVNAHCHLELSHLAGLAERVSAGFVPWVEALLAQRGQTDADTVRAATRKAIRQLESTGTVAVGDVSNTLAHLDLLEAAHLQAVVFYELLGWDPARAPEHPERRRGRDGAVEGNQDEDARAPGRARAALGVARAAGRGASSAVGRRPCTWPSRRRRPGSWPRATETGARSWSARGSRASRSKRRARAPSRTWTPWAGSVRGWWPRTACRWTRRTRPSWRGAARYVALCPRSNRNLRVGVAPVRRLLDAGVRLCLGTDSLASAETLDLMADMALLQSQFPELAPQVIVHMATLGGAEALGLAELGAIEPGRRADLAFVPADRSPADPLRFLTSGTAQAGPLPGVSALLARAAAYGRMVKLSHSVFALPFALASAALAGGGRVAPGARCCGSWWRWSARAARPWASTAWPTTPSTPATRARPGASCRAASCRARGVGLRGRSPPPCSSWPPPC